MRIRILILVAILLLVLPAVTVISKPVVEWTRTYKCNEGYLLKFSSIAITSKHIYIIGTLKDSATGKYNMYLIVTDHQGNLRNKIKIGIEGARGYDVKAEEIDGDEYVYIAGYHYTGGKYSQLVIAYKNLGVLWIRKWYKPTGAYESAFGMVIHGDKIYVVGERYESQYRAVLTCLRKSDGKILWMKDWTKDKGVFFWMSRITMYNNEIYLFGGLEKVDRLALVVLKYSLDGDLLSVNEYDSGEKSGTYVRGVAIYNDNIYVAGEVWKNFENTAVLWKFDTNLNKIWEGTYGETGAFNWFTDIVIFKEHIYAIRNVEHWKADESKIIVSKFDLNGNQKWMKEYHGSVVLGFRLEVYGNRIYLCGVEGPSLKNTLDMELLLMSIGDYFNLKVETLKPDCWIAVDGDRKPGPVAEYELLIGEHELQVASEVVEDGVKYVFKEWSDGATENPRTIDLVQDMELGTIYDLQYMVEVETEYSTASGGGWYNEGETATISIAETQVEHGNGTRRVFEGWSSDGAIVSTQGTYSFTVTEPRLYMAEWKTQYYVTAATQYSTASGEGWYDKDSVAVVAVAQTVIQGIPYNKVFKGWRDETGAIVSTQQTYSVVVDKPKTLTAVWEEELNIMVIGAVGIGVLALAIIVVLLKRRKPSPPTYPPPPPPPP